MPARKPAKAQKIIRQERFGDRTKARFLTLLAEHNGIQSQALLALVGRGRNKG